jgi:hypothetical protein
MNHTKNNGSRKIVPFRGISGIRCRVLYTVWTACTMCALILLSTCSVVFTASISGSVLDAERYEEDPEAEDNGIEEVVVYLYLDEESWTADLAAWNQGEGGLPDFPAGGEPAYFSSTVSDAGGEYIFGGLIWERLFSEYGKSGDRYRIYLHFYHPDYGLQPNPYPLYIISDVTNQLAPIKIEDRKNHQRIKGAVYDYELYVHDTEGAAEDEDKQAEATLQGVTVNVYVPDEWEYDADGTILWDFDTDGNLTTPVFPDEPSYTLTTDADGEYETEILYWMNPNRAKDRGTVQVLLTFTLEGYAAVPGVPPGAVRFRNDIDVDQDGDIEDDDVCYVSPVIDVDSSFAVAMDAIDLVAEVNEATITGTVYDREAYDETTGDGGIGGVTVRIYVPEEWEYDADGNMVWQVDENGILESPVVGSEPTYTAATDTAGDTAGEFSQLIEYAKMPDEAGDLGTVRVLIAYQADGYTFDPDTDEKLRHDVDLNRDGEIDEDEYYYLSSWVSKDTPNNTLEQEIGDIFAEPVSAENSATLRGVVYNANNSSRGVEGVTVNVYVPEKWEYDDTGALVWEYDADDVLVNPRLPEDPVTAVTDADGEWELEIAYRKISAEDASGMKIADINAGIVNVVITYELDDYRVDPDGDDLTPETASFDTTEKGIDLDGDGDGDAYYLSEKVTVDTYANMADMDILQVEFTEVLEGQIFDEATDSYVNGLTVRLYVDRTTNPTFGDTADYTTTTRLTPERGDGSNDEKGYFVFPEVEWSDDTYTGNQSSVPCYIHVAKSDGTVERDDVQITLYSDADNNVEITY